jgi:hypothetical protein
VPARTVKNGGKPWDATTLGRIASTSLFRTRAAGLTLGG